MPISCVSLHLPPESQKAKLHTDKITYKSNPLSIASQGRGAFGSLVIGSMNIQCFLLKEIEFSLQKETRGPVGLEITEPEL